MNAVKQLTDLQKQIGYNEGPISLIALLGLFGESGEVMAEWLKQLKPLDAYNHPITSQMMPAMIRSSIMDRIKKEVRDNKKSTDFKITLPLNKSEFEAELADVFYYLNALAINIGSSIDDLAKLSHAKVSSRIQYNHDNGIANSETTPKPNE